MLKPGDETKNRGADGIVLDDPDHESGLPWRKNPAFLWALRKEHGDAWVNGMIALSEQGVELPSIRLAYRMWLYGARCALVTFANDSQLPGDEYLESMLERPSMYAGMSVQTFEAVLLNVLNFRATVYDVGHDPREILRKTYLARFGKSAGSGGPAPRLIAQYGDDPAHPEIRAFYKAFVKATGC